MKCMLSADPFKYDKKKVSISLCFISRGVKEVLQSGRDNLASIREPT